MMQTDIFEKFSNSGWSLWSHKQKFQDRFYLNNIELQSVSRQISILNFFSRNIKHIPARYTPISFENSMMQKPVKFLQKFSTHQYIFLHDYLVKILLYPRTMSALLGNYFKKDCIRLHFFARVTFPSLYHNFVTEELHKAGALLVKHIIENQPEHLIKAFMLSFIEFSQDFFWSLWSIYEQMEIQLKEKNQNDNNEHPECLFSIFITSLSKSLFLLSKSQIELFQILLNRSEKVFGSIILHTMFPHSYIEYFQNKIKEPKQSAIYQMLQTSSFYPNSPFFKKIAQTMTNPQYYKIRPSHKESGYMNQTPIVLSLHEFFLIQKIIFDNSKSKPKNGNTKSESNKNPDYLNKNKIFTFKKKSGIFVFSAELCNNNFDPIFLDLNLSSVFSKSEDPNSISLFPINDDESQNQKEKDTKKFIKNFNVYLSSLAIEKVYQQIIHAKKFELFIIIGIYSKKYVDYTLKYQNSSDLFLRNTYNIMQSSNSSMTIPTDSLNQINISIPTSLSINSIYQADFSFLTENDKNNIDIEEKEKKVQKVIHQLDLNEDFKDQVDFLIEKFGKPNDAITLFILLQHLDILKSKNQDKKDDDYDDESESNESTYLELNYADSLKKFKKKLKKFGENSENSLKIIDKNGYFQKFIQICANEMDELANQNHFRMIFGLVFISLELNYIASQLSKSEIESKNQISEKMIPFINSVFLSSNNKMFDAFVWYHKFVNTFPEIKKVIPKKARIFIEFIVNHFYQMFDFRNGK